VRYTSILEKSAFFVCFDLVCSFFGPLICGDIVGARKNVPITIHYRGRHALLIVSALSPFMGRGKR
jgi:hypothetical protein